jgi:hypothetical protein
LGIEVDPEKQVNAASAVLADWEGKSTPLPHSLPDLNAVLKHWAEPSEEPAKRPKETSRSCQSDILRTLSRVGARGRDARAESVPKAYPSKAFLVELEDCADRLAIDALVEAVRKGGIDIRFLIATVPDYVDSSSGWRADQVLYAIQSAMSANSFVLDRFRLIDWVRPDSQSNNEVTSGSRLHEKQPGAHIPRLQWFVARHPPRARDTDQRRAS